ncbi:o-succinylbenzoate synthase [Nostocoides sp.]
MSLAGSATPGAPALPDLLEDLQVVTLPMRVPFRGIRFREIALVRGPSGWGEFSPFLDYEPLEAAHWLGAAIEAAYGQWPRPIRDSVPVNATVPAVPADAVATLLERFPGCMAVKVKVAERGQALADDLDRVAAVRAVVGRDVRIRVDANGSWDEAQAREALQSLAAYDIDYAEQPCATVESLKRLRISLARNGINVRIAADESIRKAADPLRVAREHAADLLVVKVAPLGGVARALDIVREAGLPAVVSSALDSSVGISAGVALAAALPALDGPCGLGTLALMGGDVTREPMVPDAGMLRPRRAVVSADLLSRYAAAPDRIAWWRKRIRDCLAQLTEQPPVGPR